MAKATAMVGVVIVIPPDVCVTILTDDDFVIVFDIIVNVHLGADNDIGVCVNVDDALGIETRR